MGLLVGKSNVWGRLKHLLQCLIFLAVRLVRGILHRLRRPGAGMTPLDSHAGPEIPLDAVSQGVRGDAMVVSAQSYLYILGFPLGKAGPNHNGVDGAVGPISRAAIAAFQRMTRIGGNGGLDLLTLNELKRVCSLGLTIRDLACKAYKAGVKMEITNNTTTADFVTAVYYYALIDELETKVPAAVTTAQAILESNYGRQTPVDLLTGKCSYNLFGVKGKGPAGSVTCWTRELDQATGSWVRTVAQYEAYNSFAESIQNHNRLLAANPVGPEAPHSVDPVALITRIANAGKIPDRHYAASLIQIIKDWGFT